MAEIKTLIKARTFQYKGLFDLKELYMTQDNWLKQRGYKKVEVESQEQTDPTGKSVSLHILPYKKISDYAKIEIRMIMDCVNVTDVEVVKGGIKHRLKKGEIGFLFDAYLITDYEHHYESTAVLYFLRTLLNKFVYRIYTSKWEDQTIRDCREFQDEIRSFLNMHRY